MSDTNVIGLVGTGFGKLFARNFLSAAKYAQEGETQKALLSGAKGTNSINIIFDDVRTAFRESKTINQDLKNTWQSIKDIDASAAKGNLSASDVFTKAKNFDKAANLGLLNMGESGVVEWSMLKGTLLEKKLANSNNFKWILDLDKNMLGTKWGTKLVEKAGGKIVVEEVVKEGAKQTTKKVSGNLASRLLANTLAKACHLNVIFSFLLEIPEIKKGFDNGDGANQIGRSATNVAFSTALIGLGSAIGRALPTKYKTIASLFGAAIGSGVGLKAGNEVGSAIFGEKTWDSNPFGYLKKATFS